ncbi:MAG: hypothetical protein JW945_03930 [Methanomicrobia archaeon]|nr:hypothetical protein [Methanomicrobia archaeon]
MRQQGQSKQLKFDEIFRLLHFCRTVETEGTDPFDVDVKRFLQTLKQYQKKWRSLDELLLDADAIAELAKIIELQEHWIKDRSSSFYVDPALLELKLRLLEPQQLATAFLAAWRPIIAQDRLTPQRLQEGLDYWHALLPFDERAEDFPFPSVSEAPIELEDLIESHLFSKHEFDEVLRELSTELEARGRIDYRDFIYNDSFETSVRKAYLTSYLVSEGRANLEINPLEEEVFISPRTVDEWIEGDSGRTRSIPVSVSYEAWRAWKKQQHEKRNLGHEQSGS